MKIGEKYLITTSEWFFAPDGETYRAVFGTVHAVESAEETLGAKTNRGSTNWYIHIGCMIVAGCQVNYAIRIDAVSDHPGTREIEHEGRVRVSDNPLSRIFRADP